MQRRMLFSDSLQQVVLTVAAESTALAVVFRSSSSDFDFCFGAATAAAFGPLTWTRGAAGADADADAAAAADAGGDFLLDAALAEEGLLAGVVAANASAA